MNRAQQEEYAAIYDRGFTDGILEGYCAAMDEITNNPGKATNAFLQAAELFGFMKGIAFKKENPLKGAFADSINAALSRKKTDNG